MSFEEYRQPWETGPHWELKKEFLDHYKNDFSVDRLLCLAQAYSNIELLHCSYPAPVMFQIHELSKPLKECKRFRGNQVSKNESPQNQKGKRKLEDSEIISKQKYKFIKFCSSNETSVESDNLTTELKSNVAGSFKQCEISIVEPDLSNHEFKSSTPGNSDLSETPKVEPDLSNHELKSSTPENSDLSETPKVEPDHSKDEQQSNSDLNYLIVFAKHLKMVNSKKPVNALSAIKNAKRHPSIPKDLWVDFKISITPESLSHNPVYLCDLMINEVLISQGKGTNKKKAIHEASESGYKYLLKLLEQSQGNNLSVNKTNMQSVSKKTESEIITPKISLMDDMNLNDQHNPSHNNEKNNPKVENCTLMYQQWEKKLKSERDSFILNKKLFDNSIQRQILLYDRSELYDSIEHPSIMLNYSFSQSGKSFSYNIIPTQSGFQAELLLDKKEILGTGIGPSHAIAKSKACISAIEKLRKEVYTIKVKKANGHDDGFVIKRSNMMGLPKTMANLVSDENIGCKMLKMMGWTGGGIGKKEGITEPIEVNNRVLGSGLGYCDERCQANVKTLYENVEIILKDFARSSSTQTLIFSPDFFKEERKRIHTIAGKYHLHSNSHGQADSRQLHIRRKITVTELLNIIIEAGGSTDHYELVDLSS